jgi:DNA invertase Pin-like site-specific DNA recombinase
MSNQTVTVQRLQAKGVALRIVNLGIDTATPTGKLMLNVLGTVAEMERKFIRERQQAGIEATQARGPKRAGKR